MAGTLLTSLQGPLQEQFGQFYLNRVKLRALYNNTKMWEEGQGQRLKQRSVSLSDDREVRQSASEETPTKEGFLRRMVDVERFLEERPKILIIGQVKSGKSFLANLILRKKLLPTDEGPCTGRMVVLKSCKNRDGRSQKPKLRVLAVDGRVVEELELELKQDGRPFVPSKYIRERGSSVQQTATLGGEWVEITMNDPLLEYFEVIDSPGLDENIALDKLVNETVRKGLVHSLIYVIDGCEGLTTKA